MRRRQSHMTSLQVPAERKLSGYVRLGSTPKVCPCFPHNPGAQAAFILPSWIGRFYGGLESNSRIWAMTIAGTWLALPRCLIHNNNYPNDRPLLADSLPWFLPRAASSYWGFCLLSPPLCPLPSQRSVHDLNWWRPCSMCQLSFTSLDVSLHGPWADTTLFLSRIHALSSAVFLSGHRDPFGTSVNPKGILIDAEYSLEGLMLKLQYFGHLMRKADSLEKTLIGKDWRQKENGMTEDEMVGWHYWLNGHEFEQTPGYSEGQGNLECCSPWDCRVGHDWVNDRDFRKVHRIPQKQSQSDLLWILNNIIFWDVQSKNCLLSISQASA